MFAKFNKYLIFFYIIVLNFNNKNSLVKTKQLIAPKH